MIKIKYTQRKKNKFYKKSVLFNWKLRSQKVLKIAKNDGPQGIHGNKLPKTNLVNFQVTVLVFKISKTCDKNYNNYWHDFYRVTININIINIRINYND